MSDVGSWDPKAGALDQRQIERIRKGSEHLDADDFGLSEIERGLLVPVMAIDPEAWQAPVENVDSKELIEWIRFFTLAEMRLPGFDAGARSPVVALARVLRGRGDYPDDLTAWIKANTDNRFLPHGSLMDRL